MRCNKHITVSLEAELYEKLCKIAKEETRTVSGQARYWLRLALIAWEKQQKAFPFGEGGSPEG